MTWICWKGQSRNTDKILIGDVAVISNEKNSNLTWGIYRKISNIKRTKSPNLNDSRLVL